MWRFPSILIVLAASTPLVHAQDAAPRVGQKVVTRQLTPSWPDGQVVVDGSQFQLCTVHQVDSDTTDLAIDHFTRRTEADPKTSGYYFYRAMLWFATGETDKALADYDEVIRIVPTDAHEHLCRGWAWQAKTDYDKALADYDEVIRLDPKSIATHFNRSLVWYDKTEYGKALPDFNEATRLDPKSAYAVGSRAWIWATCPDEMVRDGKNAVESATRACELSE